jgi:cupin fold WbuC family metalloprotein
MNDNEVYFNQSSLIKIDENVIDSIKRKARENENGKYRLCLQHSPQDNLHEMFIVRKKGDYGRPDKHLYTTESHTIVDGAMLVIIFEDDGQIREIFEASKEHYHTYRIDTNIYHMQIPLTEQIVYYEVKLGPFTDESNIFPEWAPVPNDTEKVKAYMEELHNRIQNYGL